MLSAVWNYLETTKTCWCTYHSVSKDLRKFQFSCFCLNVLTFVSARVHGWYWPSRRFFFARNHEVVLSCRPQRRNCGSKVASNEIGQIFFSRNMMDLTNLMQSVLGKLWMELECPIKEPLKPLTLSWVAQSNYERCWFSGWKFCLARWDRQVWNFCGIYFLKQRAGAGVLLHQRYMTLASMILEKVYKRGWIYASGFTYTWISLDFYTAPTVKWSFSGGPEMPTGATSSPKVVKCGS